MDWLSLVIHLLRLFVAVGGIWVFGKSCGALYKKEYPEAFWNMAFLFVIVLILK